MGGRDAGDHADDQQDVRPVRTDRGVRPGIGEVVVGRGAAVLNLVEVLGFLHVAAQVEGNERCNGTQPERDTPTPRADLLVGKQKRNDAAERVRDHRTAEDGHVDHRAPLSATVPWGDFRDVAVGRGGFATVREALDNAHEQQHHRRPDPDLLVGWHDADDDGGQRHDDDGDHEDVLASDAVGDTAENDAAERADQEADRENAERGEKGGGGVGFVEEGCRDKRGEDGVGAPLEPLE